MDKEKSLYERAIITSIIVLIISILFKLFGVRWFDLDTDIVWLNHLNTVVMNSPILSFIYSFIFRLINVYLICAIVKKNSNLDISIILVTLISMFVRPLMSNNSLLFIIDFNLFLIPCYKKGNVKEYYLVMIMNLIYQSLSLFIRNLNYQLGGYGLVISVLLNLDYYILLLLTYLNLKKRGVTLCGIVLQFYSSLQKKLLKKHLKNYSNKGGSNHEQE